MVEFSRTLLVKQCHSAAKWIKLWNKNLGLPTNSSIWESSRRAGCGEPTARPRKKSEPDTWRPIRKVNQIRGQKLGIHDERAPMKD
jgi:hypothetical protein